MVDRRNFWIRIGIPTAAAAIVTAVVLIFTKTGERTLREIVARNFGVAEPDLLIINLPPRPSRYPGSLLLQWNALPFRTVKADDPNLERGSPTALGGTHDEMRQGQGSLAAAVFSELVEAGRNVSLSFHCEEARAVEMSARTIRDLVQECTEAGDDSEVDPATLLSVVVRAYEGRIGIRVQRSEHFSLEAWAKLNRDVQDLADSSAEGEVTVSSSVEDEFAVSIVEPTVFAFEAATVDDFLANVPPSKRKVPVEAPGDTEPARSVRKLMEVGPERIPELEQALREIGPAVEPAILDVMEEGDEQTRRRGKVLLRNLPLSPGATTLAPGEMIRSGDPVLRARGVLLLDRQGTEALKELKPALADTHPAVRFLALDKLGSLQTPPEEVVPVLEAAIEGSDAVNREAALKRAGEISIDPAVNTRIREAARSALRRARGPGGPGSMQPAEGPGP